MSAPNDPTNYDAAAAEAAAAAAAIADATAAAAAAGAVPPSPIVPAGSSKTTEAAATTEDAEVAAATAEVAPPAAAPVISPTAPRYHDPDLHRHDVLSGRGGFVNAHPGNHHLRALCAYRKKEWDDGNHATKRRIAIEIYQMVRKLNPPGRFLKKEIVSSGSGGEGKKKGKGKATEEANETSATATAAAVAAEVIDGAAADGEFR